MKKWLSLAAALVLCTGIAAACAETTVSEKVIEAYNLELNTKSNTLIVTDRSTGQKYVADTEMNRLSDPYAYISEEEGYFEAANEDLHVGLLDGQGKLILPLEYGEVDVLSDRWIAGMDLSLQHTPELLDVLRKAGVVDSGGAGLLSIAEGMRMALHGEWIPEQAATNVAVPAAQAVDFNAFTEDSVLEFGYCTEFLLRLQRCKVDLDTFDENVIKDWLSAQ